MVASGGDGADQQSGGDQGGHHGASVLLSVFNITKDSFSVSSLALPFAMLIAGPGTTLLLIVVVGLSCMYTAKLLARTTALLRDSSSWQLSPDMPSVPVRAPVTLTYSDLGRATCGAVGETAVMVTNFVTCVGAASGWFVAIGSALHDVWPVLSYRSWVLVVAAAVMPLNWLRHIEHLGYASMVSAFAFGGLIALLWFCAGSNNAVVDTSNDMDAAGISAVSALFAPSSLFRFHQRSLLAYGIVKFCFAGHEVFLSVLHSLTPTSPAALPTPHRSDHSWSHVMGGGDSDAVCVPLVHGGQHRDVATRLASAGRERYNYAMTIAFLLMIAVNVATAVGGYLAFGTQLVSNVLLNLSHIHSSSSLIPHCAQVLVAVTLSFTVPIVLLAAFEMVEGALLRRYSRQAPSTSTLTSTLTCTRQTTPITSTSTSWWWEVEGVASPPLSTTAATTDGDRNRNGDGNGDGGMAHVESALDTVVAAPAPPPAPAPAPTPAPSPSPAGGTPSMRFWGRVAVRTPITLLSVLVAVVLPHLGRVVSLVGAVGDSCLGLLFPTLFHTLALLRSYRGARHRRATTLQHGQPDAATPPTIVVIATTILNIALATLGGCGLCVGVVAFFTVTHE